MNVLSDAFRQVASDLNGRHLRWALVGGFAVSAKDLDDACEALKTITERGYHRDRDLLLAFDKSAPHAD
jgi:hypothetical protein